MRQPPENSEQGRCCAASENPKPERIAAARDGRRIGVDIDEPRLDFGDPMRIVLGLGLLEKMRALGIGLEHHLDQRLGSARGFLRQAPDGVARRPRDVAGLRRRVRR